MKVNVEPLTKALERITNNLYRPYIQVHIHAINELLLSGGVFHLESEISKDDEVEVIIYPSENLLAIAKLMEGNTK